LAGERRFLGPFYYISVMGLDITAYSKLQILTPEEIKASERSIGVPVDFGEEVITLSDSQIGSPDNWIFDMKPGTYFQSKGTEEFDFRAGSYSGYGAYRKMLSECFLGVQPGEVWYSESSYEDKPFYEQINFSDCEGFIGPKVSAKLHEDYKRGRDQWYDFLKELHAGDDQEIKCGMSIYDNWTKAFGIAADDGLVWYH